MDKTHSMDEQHTLPELEPASSHDRATKTDVAAEHVSTDHLLSPEQMAEVAAGDTWARTVSQTNTEYRYSKEDKAQSSITTRQLLEKSQ